MLELMHLGYENVNDERFVRPPEQQHVIFLVDESGRVQGFSPSASPKRRSGKRVDILFSGDTVVHPDWWGSKALQNAFLSFTVRHKRKNPRRRLYWLLVSMSYKTYLLLTNNFPTAFPRRATTPPPSLIALRDRVAHAWWGSEYDERSEILRFAVPRDRVKHGAARSILRRSRTPTSPTSSAESAMGRRRELVCFAEIDFGLAPAGSRSSRPPLLRARAAPLTAPVCAQQRLER